jgi:hypothetical protein
MTGRQNGLIGSVFLIFVATALAQEPHLVNGRLERHSCASDLAKEFQVQVQNQVGPAWIGYGVPAVEGSHWICCSSSADGHLPSTLRLGRYKLESSGEGMNFQTREGGGPELKSSYILVLFRVVNKSVGKIRVFSEDCQLDAEGQSLYWLSEVQPRESIDLLKSFAAGSDNHEKSDAAIAAIALHADPAADQALEQFVEANQSERIRKDAAFWLGNLRGRRGYEILRRLLREDPNQSFREHCVFALSISKVPEAINSTIDTARHDLSAHVRGQALFWLSQKAGQKAAAAISDAITNDPETEVKKKAVFALSQLPKDEGIPKLIQVARTNRNPEVRRDAMFWLGQSNDPRALAFFEEVLTH